MLIEEIDWPTIKDVFLKNVKWKPHEQLRVQLYLDNSNHDNDPPEFFQLSLSIGDGLVNFDELVDMPDSLEWKFLPAFTISSKCFTDGFCEDVGCKSTFDCAAAMAIVKQCEPQVTISKKGKKLAIKLQILTFATTLHLTHEGPFAEMFAPV